MAPYKTLPPQCHRPLDDAHPYGRASAWRAGFDRPLIPIEGDGAPKSADPMARGRYGTAQARLTGPRFSPEVNEFAALRSSASSWQGLIMVPGGAPAPPECRLCMPARRHRTPSRPTTPREAPLGGRSARRMRRFGTRGLVSCKCGPVKRNRATTRSRAAHRCARDRRHRYVPLARRGSRPSIPSTARTPACCNSLARRSRSASTSGAM